MSYGPGMGGATVAGAPWYAAPPNPQAKRRCTPDAAAARRGGRLPDASGRERARAEAGLDGAVRRCFRKESFLTVPVSEVGELRGLRELGEEASHDPAFCAGADRGGAPRGVRPDPADGSGQDRSHQGRNATQAKTAFRFWPRQVYAPYFETWTTDSIPAIAAKSGARFFSLAFLQTRKKGSCALTWNGTKSEPVPGPRYHAQIAALRLMGGDVMPTFGGFSADSTGDRDRRLLHQRRHDRGRLRGGDQGLPRDQAGHGRGGQLAGQHRGHRPAEQGDRAGGGVGQASRLAAAGRVHAAGRADGPGSGRVARTAERGRGRRASRHRQHHDLRLLPGQGAEAAGHGHRGDHRRA